MTNTSTLRDRLLAVGSVVAFLAVLIINYLANALPINGKTPGQISDLYPNKFTPAGITFSIWGLIYLFITIYVIYQAIVLFKRKYAYDQVKAIAPIFIVNCLANISWLFAWHYQLVGLSVVIIIVMLVTLIIINQRLQLAMAWSDLRGKFCLDVPFSLYLGWISIATIANITVLFTDNQIVPLGISSTSWTIIMLVVPTLLTVSIIWFRKNFVFALVVCWAYYGIIVKRNQEASLGSRDIITAAEICIAIIILIITITSFIAAKKANIKERLKN